MEIDDLPEEESRSIQGAGGFEGSVGNPISSSGYEAPNDDDADLQQQQQQSPSRKRKLEATDEEEFGSRPHGPALKQLHVEEEQEQQHDDEQNNYPQPAVTTSQVVGELSTASQILGENSAAAVDTIEVGILSTTSQILRENSAAASVATIEVGELSTASQILVEKSVAAVASIEVGELSTASQILGENSAAAAVAMIEDKEDESFIENPHQSALEGLLVDEADRSGNSCKESLSALIRSAVEDEIPYGDEYNNSVAFRTPFEPPPVLGEGLRSHEIRNAADIHNVLGTSRSPLPDLKALQGVEIAKGTQVLVSAPVESEFGEALPDGEICGEQEATEMHVNDLESQLEAQPHVLERRMQDEPHLRMSDPQLELEAVPIEEGKFEGGESTQMREDDNPQQPELVALPEAETRIEYPPQLELEALGIERSVEDETEMRVDHHHHQPQPELEALQHVEEIIGGEVETTQMLPVSEDLGSGLGFVHAVISAANDVANVSVSDPHPDSETLHVVENSSGENESTVGMHAHPLSQLEAMDAVEIQRGEGEAKVQLVSDSSAAELDAPAEVGESNSAEDSQTPEKKRKMILLAAVAAFFSTLAGALGSIGELIGQLEKTAMAGVSEDRDGHLARTGMEGMTSTCFSPLLSESTALRMHSAMTRSSSSLRNNIVVSMFLLMQEHRKRTQKRPRELTGPWYIKPRSAQAIESFLDFSPQGDPEKFRELFRISPNLFFHICDMVRDEMLSDTPRSLRVLPNRVLTVERQVAIAIRRLATGNQFLGIADSFGVSKSTAVKVTWKFIVAFIKKARPVHLQWPNGEQMQQIKDGFKNQWGFPNCCGVVDGTHFTVEFPKGEDVTQYCDHQNHVSISMQAIVGHDQRFLDVVVGWPGSVQEYQLLQNTNFFRNVVVTKERLNGDPFITQDGSSLREYVLGDGGYPLYDWLMVPYPSGLSAAKDEWNSRHAVARQCVEDALVRLKGTWRILSRILWKPRKERIGKMVFACCLLHNMIIERRDGLNPEVYAGVNPHPGGYTGVSIPTDEVFEGGPEAREVLFREVMGGGII